MTSWKVIKKENVRQWL